MSHDEVDVVVTTTWPSPIACVYKGLLDDLAKAETNLDAATGAMLLLKDLAEVMTCLPCVVMARDLARVRPDSSALKAFRAKINEKLLAFGDWKGCADNLAKEITRDPPAGLIAASVAGVFCRKPPEAKPEAVPTLSDLGRQLGSLVGWRNDTIGHAPRRRDLQEILDDVRSQFRQLKDGIRKLEEIAPPWNGLSLGTARSPDSLMGYESTCSHGDDEAGRDATSRGDVREPLLLVREDGSSLELAPYAAVRLCATCKKRRPFLFSSRKYDKDTSNTQYYFFEYFAGHVAKDKYRRGRESDWTAESVAAQPIDYSGSMNDGVIIASEFESLFDAIRVGEDYVRPESLHKWVAEVLRKHPKGILCLRAPAHSGKSVFAQADGLREGLASQQVAALVQTFHIRRELHYGEAQWNAFIEGDVLRDTMNIRSKQPLEWINQPEVDAKGAFAKLLSQLGPGRKGKPVLLCIDGLDELPVPGDARSVVDFIPHASDLPDGFFLLLTCRPEKETPEWLEKRLDPLLRSETGDTREDVSLEIYGPGVNAYEEMLRGYFDKRLKDQHKAKQKKEKDALFEKLRTHAESTFLYFSLLVKLHEDGIIEASDVDSLHQGAALNKAYLDRLRHMVGDRQFDRIERVLLTLAAAEEAAIEDARIQPPGCAEEWRGLEMNVLGELLDELWTDTSGAASFRLLFALQTIRTVLRSWQGNASKSSRYRLGLKGLLESMRADPTWSERLDTTHRRLVEGFLLQWDGRFSEINALQPEAEYMLRFVVPHALACTLEDVGESVATCEGLMRSLSARAESLKAAHKRDAVCWYSLQIECIGLTGGDDHGGTEVLEDTAYLVGTRARLLFDLGGYYSTYANLDSCLATEIIDELRVRQGLEHVREDIRAMIPQVLEGCLYRSTPKRFYPLLESVLSQSRLDGNRRSLLHLLRVTTEATGLSGNCDFVRSIEAAREFIHVRGNERDIDTQDARAVYESLWDSSARLGDAAGVFEGIRGVVESMEQGHLDDSSIDYLEYVSCRKNMAIHKHSRGDVDGAMNDIMFCMEQAQKRLAVEPDELSCFAYQQILHESTTLLATWRGS
jgi:hypothetical protein